MSHRIATSSATPAAALIRRRASPSSSVAIGERAAGTIGSAISSSHGSSSPLSGCPSVGIGRAYSTNGLAMPGRCRWRTFYDHDATSSSSSRRANISSTPRLLEDAELKPLEAPPHIHELADEIVRLNMMEVAELMDRIGPYGFDDAGFGGGGGDDGDGAAAEEVVEAKTAFDLKLTGFDAKSKIKVIKEVRAITSLGLKEAKALVDGAPTTVKKDIKQEEADELKTRLEAVGATVEIV